MTWDEVSGGGSGASLKEYKITIDRQLPRKAL